MLSIRLSVVLSVVLVVLIGGAARSRAEQAAATEIYSINPDGSGLADLSNSAANDRFPAESPRGGRIAFVSDRDGFDAIYVMDDDGADQHRLTDRLTESASTRCPLGPPVWSPNGSTIAFDVRCRSLYEDPHVLHGSIDVVSSAGGRTRELVPEGYGPSFSADGRFVVYTTQTNVISPMTVGVVAADGGAGATLGVGSSPSWSPRGHRLAFAWQNHGLAVVDATGRSRRWTFPTRMGGTAAWSRDGKLLAMFLGGARPGIYLVRPGGRRAKRLVDLGEPADVYSSPNGRWLALRGEGATYVVRSDGRYLAVVGRAGAEPVWSPRSSFVAWADPSVGIAVTRLSGDVTTLVASSSLTAGLTWAHDGGRLIFAAPL